MPFPSHPGHVTRNFLSPHRRMESHNVALDSNSHGLMFPVTLRLRGGTQDARGKTQLKKSEYKPEARTKRKWTADSSETSDSSDDAGRKTDKSALSGSKKSARKRVEKKSGSRVVGPTAGSGNPGRRATSSRPDASQKRRRRGGARGRRARMKKREDQVEMSRNATDPSSVLPIDAIHRYHALNKKIAKAQKTGDDDMVQDLMHKRSVSDLRSVHLLCWRAQRQDGYVNFRHACKLDDSI